jgi:hypothetical protein
MIFKFIEKSIYTLIEFRNRHADSIPKEKEAMRNADGFF